MRPWKNSWATTNSLIFRKSNLEKNDVFNRFGKAVIAAQLKIVWDSKGLALWPPEAKSPDNPANGGFKIKQI
jgi:hypothetical protein